MEEGEHAPGLGLVEALLPEHRPGPRRGVHGERVVGTASGTRFVRAVAAVVVERRRAEVLQRALGEAQRAADEERAEADAVGVHRPRRRVGGFVPQLLGREVAAQDLRHDPAQRQRVRHAPGGEIAERLVGGGEHARDDRPRILRAGGGLTGRAEAEPALQLDRAHAGLGERAPESAARLLGRRRSAEARVRASARRRRRAARGT